MLSACCAFNSTYASISVAFCSPTFCLSPLHTGATISCSSVLSLLRSSASAVFPLKQDRIGFGKILRFYQRRRIGFPAKMLQRSRYRGSLFSRNAASCCPGGRFGYFALALSLSGSIFIMIAIAPFGLRRGGIFPISATFFRRDIAFLIRNRISSHRCLQLADWL